MTSEMFTTHSLSLLNQDTMRVLQEWEARLVAHERDLMPLHHDVVVAFKERAALSALLKLSRDDLKDVNPAMFPFLHPYQKELIKRRLVRAHYLHALQCRIDTIEIRLNGVKRNTIQCHYYEKLLDSLQNPSSSNEPITPDEQLHEQSSQSEKPLAWFGMVVLAPLFSKHLSELFSGKASAIKSIFHEIDRRDVYLGWSRSLILSILNVMPKISASENQLEDILRNMGPHITYINFLVVQTCFAIELLTFAKNSLAGAWATRHEKIKIPVWEQFTHQWNQRRFALMSWFFAAGINAISFLWMMNVLPVWPWGVMLAVGFRLVQICFLVCRYEEDLVEYRETMKNIQHEVSLLLERQRHLTEKLATELDVDKQKMLKLELHVVKAELDALLKRRENLFAEHRFKSIEFKHHLMFITGFLVGVTLFSCLLFPPAMIVPASALAIGLAGASICFATMVLYTGKRGELDLLKTKHAQHATHDQLTRYLAQFKELKQQSDEKDVQFEMKQVYLEIKQILAQSRHQAQLARHQEVTLYVNVLRDSLLPVVVISALFFAPTGVGVGIVLAALALCVFTQYLVNKYAPNEPSKQCFDEAEYLKFAADPDLNELNVDDAFQTISRFKQFSPKPLRDQTYKLDREQSEEERATPDFDAGI